MAATVVCASIVACAGISPIQPAATSKSGFAGSAFGGSTVTVSGGTPSAVQYRVFEQGATGFVSIDSVRQDVEARAKEFCDSKGKSSEVIQQTSANPPYILGNFPRVEIVFDCVDKPTSAQPASDSDPKYTKLVDLKKLLDTGVITPDEFEREKAKILSQP
jgi:hypothetical protein